MIADDFTAKNDPSYANSTTSPGANVSSVDWRKQELRQWAVQQAQTSQHSSGRSLLDEAQAIYDWVSK